MGQPRIFIAERLRRQWAWATGPHHPQWHGLTICETPQSKWAHNLHSDNSALPFIQLLPQRRFISMSSKESASKASGFLNLFPRLRDNINSVKESSSARPSRAEQKNGNEHWQKLRAFTTISTLISLIQRHQKFHLTADHKSKLTKEERGGLAVCSAFATIAVIEHEIVAVGVNYEDHAHDSSAPIKAVVAANHPGTTTNDQVYEDDGVEEEDSTYLTHVMRKFWNTSLPWNPLRNAKPTALKAREPPTSSIHAEYPALKCPKMPEALRKRGHFPADLPGQVAEHVFDGYLQSIRVEGSVLRLIILLHHILRIGNIGTPPSHFLSTFGY